MHTTDTLSHEARIQNRLALALLFHPEQVRALSGDVPVPVILLPPRWRPQDAGGWMPMRDCMEAIRAQVRCGMIYEAWVEDVGEEARWCSTAWSPFWKEVLRAYLHAEFDVDIADPVSLAGSRP